MADELNETDIGERILPADTSPVIILPVENPEEEDGEEEGPEVADEILEGVKWLKGEIDKLNSHLTKMETSQTSEAEPLRAEIQNLRSELRTLKEELRGLQDSLPSRPSTSEPPQPIAEVVTVESPENVEAVPLGDEPKPKRRRRI